LCLTDKRKSPDFREPANRLKNAIKNQLKTAVLPAGTLTRCRLFAGSLAGSPGVKPAGELRQYKNTFKEKRHVQYI
jgi:hypothetical protein